MSDLPQNEFVLFVLLVLLAWIVLAGTGTLIFDGRAGVCSCETSDM